MTELDAARAALPGARQSDGGARFVAVEGLRNLRDIGGYPVDGAAITRWGLLYRSGALGELTSTSREQMAALGLNTVVDLREDDEVADLPSVALPVGIDGHHNPVFRDRLSLPELRDLEQMYAQILEIGAAEIVAAVELLAAPGALPGLVHCSAGKDRTGLVIGLLLSALGVPDAIVAEDYGRTAEVLTGEFRDRIMAKAIVLGLNPERAAVLMGSPPEAMHAILATVRDQYGGAGGYLLAHGCSPAALSRLREQIVDFTASD